MEFNPKVQDLFSYIEDLRRAIRRLNDLNERLPKEGRVELTETYVRSRLVRAARQIATYKPVIDNLIMQPLEVWSKLSVEVYKKLQTAHANDVSTSQIRGCGGNNHHDIAVANHVQSKPKQKTKDTTTTKRCFEFVKKGTCQPNCPFVHDAEPTKQNEVKPAQDESGSSET